MRRAEGIIGRLGAFGEAAQTVLHAQGADAVAPPGQDLVRVALVRDVPDPPVARGVEHRLKRDGQFHHAQPRAQMTAGDGNGADRLGAQLVGKLAQLAIVQRLVSMMGGEVSVSSTLGEGSSFSFVVDLPQTDELPAAALHLSSSISGYEGPRRKVLVVDDNACSGGQLLRQPIFGKKPNSGFEPDRIKRRGLRLSTALKHRRVEMLQNAQVLGIYPENTLLVEAPPGRVSEYGARAVVLATGGIGTAQYGDEGFGDPYLLPNKTYCESCSSIAHVFWQHRMNLLTGEAMHADVMELVLYNSALSGMSLSGDSFFYQNPLESDRSRYPWHACPCCVGNIPRVLLSLPTWTYSKSADSIYVNLFIGSTVTVRNVAGTGMQVAVVESARNVVGLERANSSEFDLTTPHPVIYLMTEWFNDQTGQVERRDAASDKGATMRLGAYPCRLMSGSLAQRAYQQENISERHRHRYEVNEKLIGDLESLGLIVSGRSIDGNLVETIELKDHPWFFACQFHPEFTSTPRDGHPIFESFVRAAKSKRRGD